MDLAYLWYFSSHIISYPFYFNVVITVRFSQSTYRVNEDVSNVTIMLELSSSPAIDVTVQVFSSDGTATGECTTLHKYIM